MPPAVMQDADPFIGQGAHAFPSAFALRPLKPEERLSPETGLDAALRKFHQGLMEEDRASHAPLGAGAFTTAFDYRGDPAHTSQIESVR